MILARKRDELSCGQQISTDRQVDGRTNGGTDGGHDNTPSAEVAFGRSDLEGEDKSNPFSSGFRGSHDTHLVQIW